MSQVNSVRDLPYHRRQGRHGVRTPQRSQTKEPKARHPALNSRHYIPGTKPTRSAAGKVKARGAERPRVASRVRTGKHHQAQATVSPRTGCGSPRQLSSILKNLSFSLTSPPIPVPQPQAPPSLSFRVSSRRRPQTVPTQHHGEGGSELLSAAHSTQEAAEWLVSRGWPSLSLLTDTLCLDSQACRDNQCTAKTTQR